MNSSSIATALSLASGHRYAAGAKALLVNPVRWLASWISSELARRHGAAQLRAMDDRHLADIGLTRGEIEYVVRYGKRPGSLDHHP